MADPPTALAVTAEGVSCAARAVPSNSVRTACPACWLLDVSRPISSRMVFRAQGESPAPRSKQMRAARKRESCNASAAKPINLGNDKYTNVEAEPASDSDAGPGADADAGPGGDRQLGNKTGFPPRAWPYPHAVPSAAARKTQGARAHPPIPLDRPGATPSVHNGRFPPLTGGCFLSF